MHESRLFPSKLTLVGRLKNWFPIILCMAAAVVVFFPLSVYPTLAHRSPNWPLHLLVLDHLTMFLQLAVHIP